MNAKITDAAEFGEMVKKRRKNLHYTQRQLSEITGFSESFISNLENGKVTCELGKAIRLVNLLGLDLLMAPRGE